MYRSLVTAALSMLPLFAVGQAAIPELPQPVSMFSLEGEDWNISPTARPKAPPYHGPTPTSIPGARVIKTLELKALLDSNKEVLVIDVLESKERKSIPGAFWLPGAGDGKFYTAEKSRFATALERFSGSDKNRPIVFVCLNSECWLSYNASLHALEAGYKDVIWYRGGTNAWRGANFRWRQPERVEW